MPQNALPTSDTLVGTWVNETGATSNLYQSIDEGFTSPVDTDYIQSVAGPSNAPYVCKLSSTTNPNSPTSDDFKISVRMAVTGEAPVSVRVELRQGYVSESVQGTLIAYRTINVSSQSMATQQWALTVVEMLRITNYANLYLRIVAGASA